MANFVTGIRVGVSGSESWNIDDQRVDATHDAVYVVHMTDPNAREDSVGQVWGVPVIGTASTVLQGAVCVERSIQEINPHIWEVTATFSRDFKAGEEPGNEANPWDNEPKWSWSFESVEEPLLHDAFDENKAIVNSAGEPLPPVTYPVALPVLTIQRVELNFTGEAILDYVNRVNSTPFWGANAGQSLMAGVSASPKKVQERTVWDVAYTIKFKMDQYGWLLRLLDHGTYFFVGGPSRNQKKQVFEDAALQPVIGNLDGFGFPNTTDTPVFLEYHRYQETDFNALQLGPW